MKEMGPLVGFPFRPDELLFGSRLCTLDLESSRNFLCWKTEPPPPSPDRSASDLLPVTHDWPLVHLWVKWPEDVIDHICTALATYSVTSQTCLPPQHVALVMVLDMVAVEPIRIAKMHLFWRIYAVKWDKGLTERKRVEMKIKQLKSG